MPSTQNQQSSKSTQPSGPKAPTPKQLQYLRILADRTGQSFTYPRTRVQAVREISRLKQATRSIPAHLETATARRERADISRHLDERPHDAIRIRDDETTGYGSTARWA